MQGRNNFELSASIASRDIYRLFLAFAGDERIFNLAGEDHADPLRKMRDGFFVDEITHLLIGTAIANWIQLEHTEGLRSASDPALNVTSVSCGELTPDVTNDEASLPLTFKEACNKIVHAIHIVPDCSDPAENPLTSEVKLRGHKGKKAWVVYLNIPQYVRASVMNFRIYNPHERSLSHHPNRPCPALAGRDRRLTSCKLWKDCLGNIRVRSYAVTPRPLPASPAPCSVHRQHKKSRRAEPGGASPCNRQAPGTKPIPWRVPDQTL
ncbi:hypothetical protein C8J33_11630 [Rhizobium sp. PP-CC-3G-465]|nr:hypothetical protein C8J33_11630 [Rhizobium sp. PP-CC-3G-465]